jgi:hypothetical protein
VAIQHQDFDLSAEVAALRLGDMQVGAVCSFVGTVRDRNEGDQVASLELEHYPGMTEKAIEAMIDAAMSRFDIRSARVIHRIGLLQPLDQIVLVAVTSAHRITLRPRLHSGKKKSPPPVRAGWMPGSATMSPWPAGAFQPARADIRALQDSVQITWFVCVQR